MSEVIKINKLDLISILKSSVNEENDVLGLSIKKSDWIASGSQLERIPCSSDREKLNTLCAF